jgi:tRNA-dihydrouridine synthase C
VFQWISHESPALVLAPMEGVTDAVMRAFMTERGGFTFCVSEFLRISQTVLPPKVYFEHVPEYSSSCRTPSGVPVQIQLLGGNEEVMAESARRAWELGAGAIDINFGCPSPQVNRNDGGASLLRYPERIRAIVSAVRQATPTHIPVSAKLRLGWDSMEQIYVNAEQAALGGASWITIHARTKVQGYAPPAHWRYIGEVRRHLDIPVVANGDIWTLEDFLRCREVTGCQHFMLGRGALADPSLVPALARELGISGPLDSAHLSFDQKAQSWLPLLQKFGVTSEPYSGGSQYTARRMKQWLKMAHLRHPLTFFDEIKTATTTEELISKLQLWSDESQS